MMTPPPALRRPRLSEAPPEVRAVVVELLGGPIRAEHPAAAGFTRSIASVVVGDRARRLFVKAAPIGDGLGEAVEAGAILAGVIGDLGPALVGAAELGVWRVTAYHMIDGHHVTQWTAADRAELRTVLRRMREILDPCPIPALTTPYAEAFRPLLGTWQALHRDAAAPPQPRKGVAQPRRTLDASQALRPEAVDHPLGRPLPVDRPLGRPLPVDHLCGRPLPVDHLCGRPLPVDVPIAVLAELESRWLSALAAGTALHHGDLRRDNVIRQPDGRLRIVDWTHLWTAPGWMDLVRLAPDLAACGHDPEKLLQDSPWHDAPPDDVNAALAGLAGRAWREGLLPGLPDLPGLRQMQREQGFHLLTWLAARLS